MGDTHAPRSSSFPAFTRLQRLVIVGVEGSGKTTLAQQLAGRLGLPHVELDALYWDANWTRVSPPLFRERVAQALDAERWVTDGQLCCKIFKLTQIDHRIMTLKAFTDKRGASFTRFTLCGFRICVILMNLKIFATQALCRADIQEDENEIR